jgi:hypothetical protein
MMETNSSELEMNRYRRRILLAGCLCLLWIVFVVVSAPQLLWYHEAFLPKVLLKLCGLHGPTTSKETLAAFVYTLWGIVTLGGSLLAFPMFRKLTGGASRSGTPYVKESR